MSSPKGLALRLLGGLVLHEATVVANQPITDRFRLLRLDTLPPARPGDKLQVLLPDDEVRTYTPTVFEGRPALLAWLHGEGPGARWAASVAAATRIRFKGPDRSLSMPDGPIVLIGDETSVAVAASHAARGPVTAIFATDHPSEVQAAATALGLRAQTFAAGDTAGVAAAARAAGPGAIGITGGSALIHGVRAALRGADVRVKAYWAPGRRGLD